MKAIEIFKSQIKRTENLLLVHKKTYPRRPVKEGEAADLLRMVVVFAVAALDAYLHMRILERVSKIVEQDRRLPEKCLNIVCSKYKEKEKGRIEEGRDLIAIALKPKADKIILSNLKNILSLDTFQSPEQINYTC